MFILCFMKRQKYAKSESWIFKAILPLKTNEKKGKKSTEKEAKKGRFYSISAHVAMKS